MPECMYQCFQCNVALRTGSKKGEAVTLDVHALAELRDKGLPVTDDSPKYNYTKAHDAHYGKCPAQHLMCEPLLWIRC